MAEILYRIFGFVPNDRGRTHEHKAPLHKRLREQAFVSPEPAYGHGLVGFVLKCTTQGRCSSAGGYQTALHYCERPLLDWGGGGGGGCLYSS